MRNWKRGERVLAELLGCQRIPLTGHVRSRAYADLLSDWLSVEIKTRKTLPIFLNDALDSAEKGATYAERRDGKNRLPIAVIHQDHTDYQNSIVCMRLKDANDWFGLGK
jgi:hypothetical protein